ncbi:hypothetical protein ACVKN3_002876 [Luteibacter sp. PvP120]
MPIKDMCRKHGFCSVSYCPLENTSCEPVKLHGA